jgi:hypothetical protein
MRTVDILHDVRRLPVYLGTYLLVVGTLFGLFWLMESEDRNFGDVVSQHGVVTTATITSSAPENHNTICFTYSADGVPYSGCDAAHFGKLASELQPGSSTFITYDGTNPAIYCACSAQGLVKNAREAPIVGALWIGTFLWAVITYQLRRKRASARSASVPA